MHSCLVFRRLSCLLHLDWYSLRLRFDENLAELFVILLFVQVDYVAFKPSDWGLNRFMRLNAKVNLLHSGLRALDNRSLLIFTV